MTSPLAGWLGRQKYNAKVTLRSGAALAAPLSFVKDGLPQATFGQGS